MNYIDYIPLINGENSWDFDNANKIIIKIKNKGFFNSLAVRLFNKPENYEIELDRYGSFVWQQINGENTIKDIIEEIIETFQEERILATKRAVMFFEMLRMHHLIEYKK